MAAVATASLAIAIVPASALAATDTWTGGTAAGAGAGNWTNATNWTSGGTPAAPASGDSLDFPVLTCSANTTCTTSGNDEPIDFPITGISIDAGGGYTLSGNEIKLGSGGLKVTASAAGYVLLGFPIKLDSTIPAHTWSLSGDGPVNSDALRASGSTITGPTSDLEVDMSNYVTADFHTVDVGALTFSGATVSNSGTSANQNGGVFLSASSKLNVTSRHAVNANEVNLTSNGGEIGGPFTSTGANLEVGGNSLTNTVTFDSAAALDSATNVQMWMIPGSTAGMDYSQMIGSAAGSNINLGGASLSLNNADGSCSNLAPGTVATLVTTSGILTGTFGGISDGTIVNIGCIGGTPQQARINYHRSVSPETVTATILGGTPGAVSTSTTLSVPSSPTAGSNVSYTATVTPASGLTTPTGSVKFTDNGNSIGCDNQSLTAGLSSSTATCAVSNIAAGSHTIVATYSPADSSFSGSNDTATFQTQSVPPTVTTGTAALKSTGVMLSGTINPNGTPLVGCAFGLGTSASPYQYTVPCDQTATFGGTAPINVTATIPASKLALTPGTIYHYQLFASGGYGGGDLTFLTPPPAETSAPIVDCSRPDFFYPQPTIEVASVDPRTTGSDAAYVQFHIVGGPSSDTYKASSSAKFDLLGIAEAADRGPSSAYQSVSPWGGGDPGVTATSWHGLKYDTDYSYTISASNSFGKAQPTGHCGFHTPGKEGWIPTLTVSLTPLPSDISNPSGTAPATGPVAQPVTCPTGGCTTTVTPIVPPVQPGPGGSTGKQTCDTSTDYAWIQANCAAAWAGTGHAADLAGILGSVSTARQRLVLGRVVLHHMKKGRTVVRVRFSRSARRIVRTHARHGTLCVYVVTKLQIPHHATQYKLGLVTIHFGKHG
jgi:hypothetical protein